MNPPFNLTNVMAGQYQVVSGTGSIITNGVQLTLMSLSSNISWDLTWNYTNKISGFTQLSAAAVSLI